MRAKRKSYDGTHEDHVIDDSGTAAVLVVAFAYLIFCAPLAWVFAKQGGQSAAHILLFLDLPKSVQEAFQHLRLPPFSTPAEQAFWFSLGAFYGVLLLVYALLTSGRIPLLESIVAGFSFFYGYLITIQIVGGTKFVLQTGPFGFTEHTIKIIYIYVAYIIVEALKGYLVARMARPQPVRFLFDGTFGLLVGFFISFGHEHELPEIFVGPLFLINSFLCIIFCENVFIRAKLALFFAIERLEPKLARWRNLYSARKFFPKASSAIFAQAWREGKKPINEMIERAEQLIDAAHPNRTSSTIQIHLVAFSVFFVLWAGWPLVLFGANWFMFNRIH